MRVLFFGDFIQSRQFFFQAVVRNILTGAPVPVGGIACIAFNAVQVSVDQAGQGIPVLLHEFMRLAPLPVPGKVQGLPVIDCHP